MSGLQLWHGRSIVQVKNIDEDCDAIKVCSIDTSVFLLTSKGTVYCGTLEQEERGLSLSFQKLKLKAIDIGCSIQKFYLVNITGNVISSSPEYILGLKDEENLEIGENGIELISGSDLHVRSLKIGGRGIAFVNESTQLWVSGWQRELGVDGPHLDSNPQLVDTFAGRHVLDVSLGTDFGLVLLQPRDGSDEDRSPSPCGKIQSEKTIIGSQHINAVFANVDAARDYLKRQLTWVSGDVVGFVRNVGDLVPRREVCESCESFEELTVDTNEDGKSAKQNKDKIRKLSEERETSLLLVKNRTQSEEFKSSTNVEYQAKCDDGSLGANCEFGATLRVSRSVGGSCVTLSGSSHGSDGERSMALARAGLALLDTEIWSWGDNRSGQLGLGDMVKRLESLRIRRLRGCGVRRVECGAHHAMALLLDGRVFTWGERRSSGGIASSPDTSPRLIELPDKLRAKDIAAHNDTNLVLAGRGRAFLLSRHSVVPEGLVELSWPKDCIPHQGAAHRILCTGQLCSAIYHEHTKLSDPQYERLVKEQLLLEDILEVRRLLLNKLKQPGPEVECLLRCHRAVLGVTALNVATLMDPEHGQAAVMRNHMEMASLYQQFLASLCNAISIGALHQTSATDNKTGEKVTVVIPLCRPLDNISIYAEEAKAEAGDNSDQAKIWKSLLVESKTQLKSAEETKQFWDSISNRFTLRAQLQEGASYRRLIRDSRSFPLELVGAGRFSAPHWFILLSDCLAHVTGSQVDIYNLCTVWVDPVPDTANLQNALQLTTPECNLTVKCPSPHERSGWLQALQTSIKATLKKPHFHTPPTTRTTSHKYTKHVLYKGAQYSGRWVQGRPQGTGRMEWPDGKIYVGQFNNGLLHGNGRQDFPDKSVYEGNWVDGHQNGYGVQRSARGDVYEGHFLNGLPHGHGVCKKGQFLSSVASVYVGEWVAGKRQGYGVSDDISSGEKFLGLWANDVKHGCGMVVTLDGIYYEGNFTMGNLTGRGVMVWEDGSCHEGEFGAAGVFAGKGKLLLSTGDKFEGILHGAWNEGVKVSGTFYKNVSTEPHNQSSTPTKPSLFGKLSVLASEKWKSMFRECLEQLGIVAGEETNWEPGGVKTVKAWEGVAVSLNQFNRKRFAGCLDTIPQYGRLNLDANSYQQIKVYLNKAFEEKQHPLGLLLSQLTDAYTATYGGVRVHPVLLGPAVSELHSLSGRLYSVIRLLFPALPPMGEEQALSSIARLATTSMPNIEEHQRAPQPRARSLSVLEQLEEIQLGSGGEEVPLLEIRRPEETMSKSSTPDIVVQASISQDHRRSSTLSTFSAYSEADLDDGEVASAPNLLHPIMLPRVHSALFVLYALHNKSQDDEYWKKLLKWNKQLDIALMAFLGIDRKFWPDDSSESEPSRKGYMFIQAVDTLQQLKTTFSPLEKLHVIRSTFQNMTHAVQQHIDSGYLWTMDELFPVFQLVVIRAQILQLGSEIHFIEDFMEPRLLNGELGIMFTTLKACYYQILQEKIS